jgi:hypothetical protein
MAFLWKFMGLSGIIYEAAPGMLTGLAVYYIVRNKAEEV